MVSTRRKKQLVLALDAALVLAIGWVLLWAGRPVHADRPLPEHTQIETGPADRAPSTPPDYARYAALARRNLRRPLYDPKPIEIKPPEPPKPQLRLELVGTATDQGAPFGMFKTARGEVKLLGVGESVDGATVLQIAAGSATVRFAGEIHELTIKRGATP